MPGENKKKLDEIRKLIAEDLLEEALSSLNKLVESSNDLLDIWVALNGRLNSIKYLKIDGNHQNYLTERNSIRRELNSFLDQVADRLNAKESNPDQITVRIGNGTGPGQDGYLGTGFFLTPDYILCSYNTLEFILGSPNPVSINIYRNPNFEYPWKGTVSYVNKKLGYAIVKLEEPFTNPTHMDIYSDMHTLKIRDELTIYGYIGEKELALSCSIDGERDPDFEPLLFYPIRFKGSISGSLIGLAGAPVIYKSKIWGYFLPEKGGHANWIISINEEIINEINRKIPGFISCLSEKTKKPVIPECEEEIRQCLVDEKLSILINAIDNCRANPMDKIQLLSGKEFEKSEFIDKLAFVIIGNTPKEWFVEKHNSFLKELIEWSKNEPINCKNKQSRLILLYFFLKYLTDPSYNAYSELVGITDFLGKTIEEKFQLKLTGHNWKGIKAYSYLMQLNQLKKELKESHRIPLENSVFWFLMAYGEIPWTESDDCFESHDWIVEWHSQRQIIDELKQHCSNYKRAFLKPEIQAILNLPKNLENTENPNPIMDEIISGIYLTGDKNSKEVEAKQRVVYDQIKNGDFRLPALKAEYEKHRISLTQEKHLKETGVSWRKGEMFIKSISLLIQNDHTNAYKAAFGA